MALSSGSTLQQSDAVAAVVATSSGGSGGAGVSEWDDLTGELSGPVPFDATDEDGNPTSRSLRFLNVTPQVDVTSDPANGIALEIKDQTDGTRLGTLTTDGRWETRGDQEAFADGSFPAGTSTNSLLQVEDPNEVLTTDAASLKFTGSGVSVSKSSDDITVDVSGGGGSDIDIEQDQNPVVGGATGISFEGSGIDDVTNDGDGTATVSISKGSSTEVQEGGTTQVSDVTVLDFIGVDFSVTNPSGGEAEVSLQDDTVTVAGNAVSLGGSTGIAHGDLSSIGSDDHHAVFEPADYTPVSDVEAHGDALAIDISGDAGTLDGYQGNDLSALAENETVTGQRTFKSDSFSQPNSNITAATIHAPGNATNTRYGHITASSRSLTSADAVSVGMYYNVGDGTASGEKRAGVRVDCRANGDNTAIGLGGLVFQKESGANRSTATLSTRSGDAVVVGPTGNVGLAGETNPSYAVQIGGDARASGEVEAFLSSDRRLKTEIQPVDSALDRVSRLSGYGFQWREGDAVQPHKRGEADVGLIAQEVEGVLPEAVKTLSDGHSEGYKALQYDKVVPLLVEAIKDLRSQVQELQ